MGTLGGAFQGGDCEGGDCGTVHLIRTPVAHNTLNNCSPVASVPGCFG
jgi:hypothetical protein